MVPSTKDALCLGVGAMLALHIALVACVRSTLVFPSAVLARFLVAAALPRMSKRLASLALVLGACVVEG